MRTVVFALVFLLMASGLCLAQTNKQGPSSKASGDNEKTVAAVDYTRSINQSLYFQRPQVELPAGETGWTLEVDMSGGYVPSHKSITVTSKGRVTIEDSNGSCSFEVEDGFPEIDRLIAEANAAGWGGGLAEAMPTQMCNDCRLTRLSVSGRGMDGTSYGRSANWTEATFAKVRKEVAAIYAAVEKIKRQCPQR